MTMMPTINQFDGGTSLFAGSTFLASQITQAPDYSFSPAKSLGPQRLMPLTVKQINESYIANDDKSSLIVYGVESNFRILGMVMYKEERETDVSFLIDDGTGRIEISKWMSVASDSVEVAAIENGMYVQVHGHMKEFQGKKRAFAFSIRPVIDFDDVSLHFIECVCVHLQNKRLKGGVPKALQMSPVISMPFSNGVKGSQAPPVCNQFLAHSGLYGSGNDIYKIVLGIFLEPSALAREHGIHIDEVFKRLGLPKNKIMDAINYLVDVGHIYSTIDEYHFKSACNGYQSYNLDRDIFVGRGPRYVHIQRKDFNNKSNKRQCNKE